jgi:hypothetical protein
MRHDGSLLPFDLEFNDDAPTLDVDMILRRGHARLRRRRAMVAGTAAAVMLVGAAAATAAALAGGSRHSAPGLLASAGGGLLAQHPPDGRVDVLRTGRGWHPIVYRDVSGALCEGWVDPHSGSAAGRCLDSALPVASGNSGTSRVLAAVTAPILVEPQAGVSGGSVQAFGVAAPAAHSVQLSSAGQHLAVQLSSVHSAAGDHAWLATFPSSARPGHTHVRIVARNRQGTAIGSATFTRPVAGSGSNPTVATTPTTSPLPSTAEPAPSSTPASTEPTPTESPASPPATPSEPPVATEPAPTSSGDSQLPGSPGLQPPQ